MMFGTHRNTVADTPSPWKVPTSTAAPESVKHRPSRGGFVLGVLASAALVATFLAIGSSASAASSNWKLSDGSVDTTASAMPTFNFVKPDSAHLLYSSTVGASKYGTNDYNGTMTATYTVAGVTGAFTYGGEPSCGGTTGYVRLYFESILPGSKFAYTNYWWSDVAWQTLANGGPITLTSLINEADGWGDWNGQSSASEPAAFAAAASAVTAVGLSYGGGCFFENGVGTTDASGSFTLNNFGVS